MLPFPALSANTLFHFTGSLENLIAILTNEFRPHFCLEDFNVLLGDRPHQDNMEWAVPMVSFCDIPLSQTGFHLSVYGDYGIGMTKSWGRSNGITPVLYAYPGSSLTSKFTTIVSKTPDVDDNDLGHDLVDFVSFIKPYEGELWREGGKLSNIRFYDEREWRFVPTLPNDFYRVGMEKADFLNENIRREANNKLAGISRIGFVP